MVMSSSEEGKSSILIEMGCPFLSWILGIKKPRSLHFARLSSVIHGKLLDARPGSRPGDSSQLLVVRHQLGNNTSRLAQRPASILVELLLRDNLNSFRNERTTAPSLADLSRGLDLSPAERCAATAKMGEKTDAPSQIMLRSCGRGDSSPTAPRLLSRFVCSTTWTDPPGDRGRVGVENGTAWPGSQNQTQPAIFDTDTNLSKSDFSCGEV